MPKQVDHVHLHSAPPCGRACQLVTINHSRGAAFKETAEEFLTRLLWARQQHKAFKTRCTSKSFSSSPSHEQSDTCRLQYVKRSAEQPRRFSARLGRKATTKFKGWPWALSPSAARGKHKSVATVHGCVVGMPVKKMWRFESDNAALLRLLQKVVCPGCPSHMKLTSRKGEVGYGTRNSERYPRLLGRLIAEAITRHA